MRGGPSTYSTNRRTGNDREFWNIPFYEAEGTDRSTCANLDTGKDHAPRAEGSVAADPHSRLHNSTGMAKSRIARTRVNAVDDRGEDRGPGRYAYEVTNVDSRLAKNRRIRAHVNVFAEPDSADTRSQDRECVDPRVVADRHAIRREHQRVAAEAHVDADGCEAN